MIVVSILPPGGIRTKSPSGRRTPLICVSNVILKLISLWKNNQFDTHYQNCSNSRYFITYFELFRTVPNDLVQISYFLCPSGFGPFSIKPFSAFLHFGRI